MVELTIDEMVIICELRIIGYIIHNPKTKHVVVTIEDFTHAETKALFHIIYDEFVIRNHGTDMSKAIDAILKSNKYKGLMSGRYTDQIIKAFKNVLFDKHFYNEECFDADQKALIVRNMELHI